MNIKAISSQSMTILVIVALIASIGGTLISMNNIKTVEVTGMATSVAGFVNATISSAADISFVTSDINFTEVAVGTEDDTVNDVIPPFNLTNDGNICVNITIVRTQTNWFRGTLDFGGDENNNNYTQYAVNTTGTNVAYQPQMSNTTWTNLSQSITSTAVGGLNWSDGNDTAQIEIKIAIPADEGGGEKSTLVTFSASDSGLTC